MSLFQFTDLKSFPNEYQICKNTGVLFYKKAKEREYKDSYFMEEYKNQYNKTYYEDEPNLRSLAKKRLNYLKKISKNQKLNLLEIGSAAGFFLDEAKKMGHNVKGFEISPNEANYSKEKLGLDVSSESFLNYNEEKKFDCIALFFVLEHFLNQEKVLEKIFSLLDKKGFLLLAIPSIHGPSFKNKKVWFESHPTDHFFDYSPKSIKNTLHYFGTEILFMEPMSYHPHREKGILGKFPLKLFYKQIANWLGYGDTLFLIARKRN